MHETVPAAIDSTQDAVVRFFTQLGVSIWIVGPALFVLWVLALWGLKMLFYRDLARFSRRTSSQLDDAIIFALSRPLGFLIVGSGLVILGRILPLSSAADRYCLVGFRLMLIFAAASFANRLVARLIDTYAESHPLLASSSNLARGLARTIVFALALFAVLDNLGVSITPVLASLGVGSLAVALALKDTLANLFAGVQLVADRTIEVGQTVRLESGEEGVVTRVGWRTTHLRTPADILVIVPNSKLTESRIQNFDRPTPALSVTVEAGVHYASDLEKVERVALEVAREVQRTVPGGMPDVEPGFAYRSFADSGITIAIVLRACEFGAQVRLRHGFVKLLHRRFAEEGIVMPYPTRTLEVGEGVAEKLGRSQPREEAPREIPKGVG